MPEEAACAARRSSSRVPIPRPWRSSATANATSARCGSRSRTYVASATGRTTSIRVGELAEQRATRLPVGLERSRNRLRADGRRAVKTEIPAIGRECAEKVDQDVLVRGGRRSQAQSRAVAENDILDHRLRRRSRERTQSPPYGAATPSELRSASGRTGTAGNYASCSRAGPDSPRRALGGHCSYVQRILRRRHHEADPARNRRLPVRGSRDPGGDRARAGVRRSACRRSPWLTSPSRRTAATTATQRSSPTSTTGRWSGSPRSSAEVKDRAVSHGPHLRNRRARRAGGRRDLPGGEQRVTRG